jgi:hypothetical protein
MKFFDWIANLFAGLDLRFQRVVTLFILILLVLGILAFEYYSGFIFYWSMAQKINLLKELNVLAKDGIAANPELYSVYERTLQQLASREIQPLSLPIFVSTEVWKVLSGAFLGLLFTVVGVVQRNPSVAFGAFAFAIIGGFLALLLPILFNPWVNFLGFPIAEATFLILYGRKSKS